MFGRSVEPIETPPTPCRSGSPRPAVELVALLRRERAKRRAHVLVHRHALEGEQALEGSLTRKALDERAKLAEPRRALGRRVPHDGRDFRGKRRREGGDGADRTVRQAVGDERLRPDEHVEAGQHVLARTAPTACPRPSARRRSRRRREDARAPPARSRSRSSRRTRRRRTAAARTRSPPRGSARTAPSRRAEKYGGPMTTTASAPTSAACAASVTVSVVVCAPQCTATWSRRSDACRKRSAARRRSSTPSRIPSPAVPRARIPSRPAATKKSTSGAKASSSSMLPVVPERRHRRRQRAPQQRRHGGAPPSRTRRTVSATRRDRVSVRFAPSTHSTYSRRWVKERASKAARSAALLERDPQILRKRDRARLRVQLQLDTDAVADVHARGRSDVLAQADVGDAAVHGRSRAPRVTADRDPDRRSDAAELLLHVERDREHRRRRPRTFEVGGEALRGHARNHRLRPMSALNVVRDGHVLRVTLARPERRNAFDAALIAELAETFSTSPTRARCCSTARAVVLRRGRRRVAASGDRPLLRGERRGRDAPVHDARVDRHLSCARRVLRPRVRARRRLWLVACADIAIAWPDAVFGFTEVRLGIIPAVISPFVLPKIGAAARRYFLTGERFDAEEALRIGLVSEVAEDAGERAEAVVRDILAGGPVAVREAKKLVRERPDRNRHRTRRGRAAHERRGPGRAPRVPRAPPRRLARVPPRPGGRPGTSSARGTER